MSDPFGSIILGVGSLFDWFGTSIRLPAIAGPDLQTDGLVKDTEAIRGDWQRTGEYLRAAMDAEAHGRREAAQH